MKLFHSLAILAVLFLTVKTLPVPDSSSVEYDEEDDANLEVTTQTEDSLAKDETTPTPTLSETFTTTVAPFTTTTIDPDASISPQLPPLIIQTPPKTEQELHAEFHSRYPALRPPSLTQKNDPTLQDYSPIRGKSDFSPFGEEDYDHQSSKPMSRNPFFHDQLVASHYDTGVQIHRLHHQQNQNMATVYSLLSKIDKRITTLINGKIAALHEADKQTEREILSKEKARDEEMAGLQRILSNNAERAMSGIEGLQGSLRQVVATADGERRKNAAAFSAANNRIGTLRGETLQAFGNLGRHVNQLVGTYHDLRGVRGPVGIGYGMTTPPTLQESGGDGEVMQH